MLTPTYLEQLPQPMIELISQLQDEIIADITKRIVKGKYDTPSAQWMLYKANQLRLSSADVNKLIAKGANVRERTVREMYSDSVKLALHEDAEIYRYAISENKLPAENDDKITSYFRDVAHNDFFKRGLKNTQGLMRNLTNSMAATANRTLSDALDLAWLEVSSGAFTVDEACFKAVTALTEKGLAVVEYKSGHKDQVDVAVRRAVRTGINKTCCDMQLDFAAEMGSDLVEVSSHLGARPTHADWQGQIYSISGKHPKYKPFSVTGYGTGDGLGGWNCRHSFFPYFDDLSIAANMPDFTSEENREMYDNQQQQRAYERAVRKSKRELAGIDAARQATADPALKDKLDKEFARKSVTLKRREERLEAWCEDKGLQLDSSRVRTAGFGRSVSQKAVWAAKKSEQNLTTSGSYGKINSPESNNPGWDKPLEYFSSKEYREKFKGIGGNILSDHMVYKAAKKAIEENYCNVGETMYLIDTQTGKALPPIHSEGLSINFSIPPGKPGKYVLVHNHPNNSPLSIEDIVTAISAPEIKKMIAVSHDGTVYSLEIGKGVRPQVNVKDMNKNNNTYREFEMSYSRCAAETNNLYEALVLFNKKNQYNWRVRLI